MRYEADVVGGGRGAAGTVGDEVVGRIACTRVCVVLCVCPNSGAM